MSNTKNCCVCGQKAMKAHYSILGSMPFYVCNKHYKTTFSAMGYCEDFKANRMGLMDAATKKWIDIKIAN